MQKLEDAEDIEVFLVKKEETKDFLFKQLEQGTQIAANLWYIFGIDHLTQ